MTGKKNKKQTETKDVAASGSEDESEEDDSDEEAGHGDSSSSDEEANHADNKGKSTGIKKNPNMTSTSTVSSKTATTTSLSKIEVDSLLKTTAIGQTTKRGKGNAKLSDYEKVMLKQKKAQRLKARKALSDGPAISTANNDASRHVKFALPNNVRQFQQVTSTKSLNELIKSKKLKTMTEEHDDSKMRYPLLSPCDLRCTL